MCGGFVRQLRVWDWGEGGGEIPSGGRGCSFGFLDGALGHGEVGSVGCVLCSGCWFLRGG